MNSRTELALRINILLEQYPDFGIIVDPHDDQAALQYKYGLLLRWTKEQNNLAQIKKAMGYLFDFVTMIYVGMNLPYDFTVDDNIMLADLNNINTIYNIHMQLYCEPLRLHGLNDLCDILCDNNDVFDKIEKLNSIMNEINK